MLFIECHVKVGAASHLAMLGRSNPEEVRYLNCMMDAHNLKGAMQQLGIERTAALPA